MSDEVCISFPNDLGEFKFPSFSDLISGIEFKFPPDFPSFSEIAEKLSLPSPIFGSIEIPNFEMNQVILSFRQFHLTYVLNTAWEKVKDLLKNILNIEITLPKIPGLDIDLSDLLSGEKNIANIIKEAIQNGVSDFINFLNSLVPSPLFEFTDSPDIDITQKIMIAINGYLNIVINLLAEKMAQVKEAAEQFLGYVISVVVPDLPEFPTLEEIIDYIKNNISIPPFEFNFPDPLIPFIDSPDFNFSQKLSTIYQEISTYVFSLIAEFFDEVSQLISSIFNIPKIKACLNLITPNITVEES